MVFQNKNQNTDEILVPSYPENGQVDVSPFANLGWDYLPRAEFFHVQVSSDNFTSLIFNDSNISYYDNIFFTQNHLKLRQHISGK